MHPAREHVEHTFSVRGVRRLAQDGVAEHHDRISSDDDPFSGPAGSDTGFIERHAECIRLSTLAQQNALINIRWIGCEDDPDLPQQFPASRRIRSQYDRPVQRINKLAAHVILKQLLDLGYHNEL